MKVILDKDKQTFYIKKHKQILFEHSAKHPAIFVGKGRETIEMNCGNFAIEDYVEARYPLTKVIFKKNKILLATHDDECEIELNFEIKHNYTKMYITAKNPEINRIWFRLPAKEEEFVWGCGEQMSYFNLRGRHFPLWTSEPGVGRDKTTEITFLSDKYNRAGGDYYNTNYPQPTFVSSRKYACHVNSTAYADFDFRNKAFHELQIWDIPESIEFFTADTYLGIIEALSNRFGKQPKLADWLYDGVILGLKGGEENTFSRMENAINHGIAVAGVWSEDWAGVRETSFGTRNFWDWKWGKKRYPHLDKKIKELRKRGIRFLAYVSPYLCSDGDLYPIAEKNGYFARNSKGEVALVDFGEFYCGIVDFTNPEACEWFKREVIQKNMIDMGISGWMADFGEYLPTEDVYLKNGVDAKIMHNAWPVLWARVNAEAVAEKGLTHDINFFMRAGGAGTQKYCPMLWAGDQCVDFSRHDGLNTVICGALSSGLLGNAYHHSDIGGYTSLFGNRRTKEVFDRWVDMATFTSMMRTHEGNRPYENFQFDQDAGSMAHLARMTNIHRHLKPYLQALSEEASIKGYPVQRPLFVHFEKDINTYTIQDEFMFGEDMLVAPVHKKDVKEWQVYLPAEETWVNIWTNQEIQGGQSITLEAPIGKPPVFFRKHSKWVELFKEIKTI